MYCKLIRQRYLSVLLKQSNYTNHIGSKTGIANFALNEDNTNGSLIISCKRKEYNHYSGLKYSNKFDEVRLASKGWTHSKSKGDYFVINPHPSLVDDDQRIKLTEINVHSEIINRLQGQDITTLTSYQNNAIAAISQGTHCILAAETGCGKTLAYLLPIIHKLTGNKSVGMNTPRALILVPNRELAYQIGSVTQPLTDAVGLNIKIVVGGRTKQMMLDPEFSDVDILIGTPGAISKLSSVGVYKLNHVTCAVLDEADTLIDDSFVERLTGIIKRISQSQIVLVSATLPTSIPIILEAYNEHFVKVISPQLHKPLSHLTQRFLRINRSMKPQQLLQLVKKYNYPLLIFTNRNDTCYWLSNFLSENKVNSSRISGNMNYNDRIDEWNRFSSEKTKILVATDVCSRGLDISKIKHVVNYDFPIYAADYLHRIGRTGRFGAEACKVTNFISGEEEIKLVQKVELAIRRNESIPNVDGNITRIMQKKFLRRARDEESL